MDQTKLKTSDFSYELPEELIAQTPLDRRDMSRLMVLGRKSGQIEHRRFFEIGSYLKSGDCLVLNDTRVLPARLIGVREGGGCCEALLLEDKGERCWECIVRPGKKLREGAAVRFGDGLCGVVRAVLPNGNRILELEYEGVLAEILARVGHMPLPHYIKQTPADAERYQTVYAAHPGSAAAPTAGLHFTEPLLDALRQSGVSVVKLTLHVGLGTFRPVKAEHVTDHTMHTERFVLPPDSAEAINECKRRGGRVVAVGTTSCRVLESVADGCGMVRAEQGSTGIFIYPGYRFRCVDGLITNFHLPESTLIMLVSALAGRENVLDAYRCAVEQEYRFFSFGDAMLIL